MLITLEPHGIFGSNFAYLFNIISDFIWDFGKLPFPTHLGKYFIKLGKIRAKIHEIGKIKAIFGLGMTPIYGLKNGQIKSLIIQSLVYKMVTRLCRAWLWPVEVF